MNLFGIDIWFDITRNLKKKKKEKIIHFIIVITLLHN